MAKKETLLLRILASTRDAVRSFRSLDGALTQLSEKAADAQEAVGDVGKDADKAAREAARAMQKLGVRSDANAAQVRASWKAAFEAIERSSDSTSRDIIRARNELNRRLGRLDREMSFGFERNIDKMARAVRSLGRAGLLASAQLARMATSVSLGGFSRLTSVVSGAASVVARGARIIVSGIAQIATASTRLFSRSVIGGGAAAGAFAIQIGTVAGEFERIAVALKATTGDDYKRASQFVEDYAKTVVFSEEQIAQSLLSLRNFGFSQADGETALPALVEQVSKLGGSYADLEGITLAVGQAWAKQKLQGEEILQLVERGVPVWDLLAKVTGKSVSEIQDLSEAGKLGRDVIRDLLKEIGKGAAGAAGGQLNTYNGLISQLTKGWSSLLREIGKSGVFDRMKNIIRGVIDFLGKPETVAIFTRFAEVGVTALEVVSEGLQNLISRFGGRAADVLERWIKTASGLFGELLDLGDGAFAPFVAAVESGVAAFVAFAGAAALALPYVLRLVSRVMSGIAGAIAGVDSNTIEAVAVNIVGAIAKIVDGVASFVGAVDGNAIRAVVIEVSGFINTLADLFMQAASGTSGAGLAQSLADGFTAAAAAISLVGRELTMLFNAGLTGGTFESGFFQAIQTFAVEEWPAIQSAFQTVIGFLNAIGAEGAVAAVGFAGFLAVLPDVIDFIDDLGGAVGSIVAFVTWIKTLASFTAITTWVSSAAAALAGFATTIAAAIAAAPLALIVAVVVGIAALAATIYIWWDEIVAAFKAAAGFIVDVFATLFDGLLGGFANLWEGIKAGAGFVVDIFRTLGNGLLGGFSDIWEAIKSGWNTTIDFLAGLIPDWVKNLFGGDASVTVNGDGSTSEGTRQFYNGGYTGEGGTRKKAGDVHYKEFVFDAESTRRLGVPALEALRNGILPRSIAALSPALAPAAQSSGRRMGIDLNLPGGGRLAAETDPAELRRLQSFMRHQKATMTAARPRGSI